MRAGAPLLHALARRDHRTEGHSATERLCGSDDVRRHAELLRGEPRTRAAHARLDLVEHEQSADLRCELADRTDEGRGGRNVAALAEHRLDHDRSDVLRRDLVLEHRVELGEAMRRARFGVVRLGQRARERVRIRGDVHLGEQRTVAAAVLRLRRREAGRTHGATVESAAEHDDRLATGRLARQLDRGLNRFGAAVAKEDRIEAARCDRGELFGESDARFVLCDSGRDVHESLRLVDDRLHHARMRMTHRGDSDAAGQIEQAPSVGRDEPAPLPALDRKPRVVAKHGRKDLASAGFEVGHRVHSIGCVVLCASFQPGRRSSPSDVTRICNVARSSPMTRTRYPGTPARSTAARRSAPW